MNKNIDITGSTSNGDKAKTSITLKESELEFIYNLVIGKATVNFKNGGTMRLPAQAVQGKFKGEREVIERQLDEKGFIYKPYVCDDDSIMISITGAKTEDGEINNEEYRFAHRDGNCYPSGDKGTWEPEDPNASHRVYKFDKNYSIAKYKPDYLGENPVGIYDVLDQVDAMSTYRLNESERNKEYPRELAFDNGYPDWSPFSFGTVEIPLFTGSREANFKQANIEMAAQLNDRYPDEIYTAEDVEDWMNNPKHEMTWEESPNGSLYKVPSILHNNVFHKGGQNDFRGEANEVMLSDMPKKPKSQKRKNDKNDSAGKVARNDVGENDI